MVDVSLQERRLVGVFGAALRSFVGTLLVMGLLGLVLAAGSYGLLARAHHAYGLLAAAVALVECAAVGTILAGKRALVMALIHALRTQRPGASLVRLVLGRLLGPSPGQPAGERGAVMIRTLERLPLAEAERRLNQVVTDLLNVPPEGGLMGLLRRRVQVRLLGSVHTYTLGRFREEGVRHGGVDLLKVQAELGGRIDGLLTAKLQRTMNCWTVLVLLGLPAQVLGLAWVVLGLLK
jgi:hypothetical protein